MLGRPGINQTRKMLKGRFETPWLLPSRVRRKKTVRDVCSLREHLFKKKDLGGNVPWSLSELQRK